ncbi:MAG TPA: metalloregulator ArsR/SmtB family transcription factor [Kofleriaceae bacterium]|nr:metalloregulator ArsR/SmtB family transcription factor [Kofleriaceae bacterium]
MMAGTAGTAGDGSTTIDATFTALADPTRRSVVDLLRKEPRRAGDLADELGLSRPAMSRHLKILRRSGLIEPASDEADARARIYRLLPEPFSDLRAWLEEVERFWSGQLAAFKAHAEARARVLHSGSSSSKPRTAPGAIDAGVHRATRPPTGRRRGRKS